MRQKHLQKKHPSKQDHHLGQLSIFRSELKERAKFEASYQKKHKKNADVNLTDMPQQQEESQHTIFSALHIPSLSTTELTGLFFLILLTSAYAINPADKLTHPIESNTNKKPKFFKQDAYEQICTRTEFVTYNKPNITIDYSKEGELLPQACIITNSKYTINNFFECEKQKNILARFKVDGPKRKANALNLNKVRHRIHVETEKWLTEASEKAISIQENLSPKQLHDFNVVMQKVTYLKDHYYSAIYMRQYNGGNCGEHLADSLEKLLNFKITHGLEMKIQMVHLSTRTPAAPYGDHAYLLLDSDVPDVIIQNDAQKVGYFLNSIKKGHVCDQWNTGYFADLASDNNGLYRSYAQWDQLKIETISLDFTHFNQLPVTAQRFVCEQLSQMGLSIEPKEQCEIFNNVVMENQESEKSLLAMWLDMRN